MASGIRDAVRTLAAGCTLAAVATVCLAQSIRELTPPNPHGQPQRIVAASDGALWFNQNLAATVVRVTPAGVFQEFAIPSGGTAFDVADGPDRAVWFTEFFGSRIGRVSFSGIVTEYPLPGNQFPTNITTGPDGALWFTEVRNRIGRMESNSATTYFATDEGPIPCVQPQALIFRDGDLWFTCVFAAYGRLTTTGELTVFRTSPGSIPGAMTIGPDGRIWFVESGTDRLAAVEPDGTLQEFPIPLGGIGNGGITAGSDGAIWFTEEIGNRVGRLTMDGRFSEIDLPNPGSHPQGIAAGPDGALWVVETATGRIARIETRAVERRPRVVPFR